MAIGKRVAIVGTGLTKFGFFPEKSYKDLVVEACYDAFQDARMDPGEIETGWFSITMPEILEQENLGSAVADTLGIAPAGIGQVVAACAGGGVGVRAGYWAVASGLYKKVLVTGVEKISDVIGTAEAMSPSHEADFEYLYGSHSVTSFALMQSSYEKKYNCRRDDFAHWPAQARWYGNRNPKAVEYKRGDMTVEQVLKAPWLTKPINAVSTGKACDGSSALILVPAEEAYKYSDAPVFIDGISFMTAPPYIASRFSYPGYSGIDISQSQATIKAAEEAYKMAGIKSADIDFAQVHDCFPVNAAIQLEGLGIFPEGKGSAAIAAGEAALDGKCPTCTDGGRHSMGHPTGATGIAMMIESVMQMRGLAGERQVRKADIAVHQTTGGSNAASVVTVLRRR